MNRQPADLSDASAPVTLDVAGQARTLPRVRAGNDDVALGALDLASAVFVASGRSRDVYVHPHDARLVVKVMRETRIAEVYDRDAPWHRRLKLARRTGRYTEHARELREYIALRASCGHDDLPIARVVGVAETDRGLGLVCARVHAPDGGNGPTLEALLRRDGLTPVLCLALSRFMQALLDCEVIVTDLRPRNIVYGVQQPGEAPRLLLTDGYGERHILPVCTMSRRFNRHNTQRHLRRLRRFVRELVDARNAAA